MISFLASPAPNSTSQSNPSQTLAVFLVLAVLPVLTFMPATCSQCSPSTGGTVDWIFPHTDEDFQFLKLITGPLPHFPTVSLFGVKSTPSTRCSGSGVDARSTVWLWLHSYMAFVFPWVISCLCFYSVVLCSLVTLPTTSTIFWFHFFTWLNLLDNLSIPCLSAQIHTHQSFPLKCLVSAPLRTCQL